MSSARHLTLDADSVVRPAHQWKCCSSEDHHEHSPVLSINNSNIPLLARKETELRESGEMVSRRDPGGLPIENIKKTQRQVLVQSIVEDRRTYFLPMTGTDNYAHIKEHHNLITSIHVRINTERAKRNILPLCRENELDELASDQAKQMATRMRKKHSDVKQLISKISDHTDAIPRRLGENICGGNTVDAVHKKMMGDPRYEADRNNIFDRRFSSFGIGVGISSKGKVYVCQIYKG